MNTTDEDLAHARTAPPIDCWIGHRFVHRQYEEQGLRFQLLSGADPAAPDQVSYCAVHVRMTLGRASDDAVSEHVFESCQFTDAAALFKQTLTDYLRTGELPGAVTAAAQVRLGAQVAPGRSTGGEHEQD